MTTRRGGKPFLITSPDARIDPDLIEESVNSTRNPFGIRANNTFATEELDEEIWGKFVRLKVESPDEREEAIPELVEGDAMLYLYLHALNKRGLTDLELVHLYLLLLDPSYHDHRQRFAFRDTPIDKRTREILAHPIRYGTGITYYTGALERTLREELSQEYASDTFDALVGRSFKTKESRPGAVVAMGTIRENMERLLLPENRLAVSDLPPLPPPQEGPENWKLPNPSWRRFTQHLTAVAMSNHLVPFGQFRYWEKEVKQAG